MSFHRMHSLALSLIATGLIVVLMSMGGGWGAAYGQSVSGPTPTVGVVAPDSGAEGNGPSRNTAVAGESSEIAGAAGQDGVAGENGGSVLENTGAESALQWPLLATGVVLFAAGAVLFARTRKIR